MSARNLLAMIAMLPVWSAVCCLAAEHEVGVYLRSDGGISQPVLDSLKLEMDSVLNQAGFRLKWWSRKTTSPIEAEELVVVDLRGSCQVPEKVGLHHRTTLQVELASTFVVGTQVLPFSTLDCGTFNELLNAALSRFDKDRRDFVYGRAMARVLAHEFYHVLVHTNKHTTKGVAKRAHSAEDLLGDRFAFDAVALSQLRRQHPASTSVAKNQTGSEGASVEAPAEPVVTSELSRDR